MNKILFIFICVSVAILTNGQSDLGGSKAPDGKYPYQAAIISKKGKFVCGASILSRRCVLTAAHCVVKRRKLKVVVGTNEWRNQAKRVIPVSKIIPHEDFEKDYIHCHDIAVLQLASNIEYCDKVQPVKLPKDSSYDYEGATAYLAGWGTLNDSTVASEYLQHVQLTVISNEECAKEWNKTRSRYIGGSQICTVAKNSKNMATRGDSGGPLVAKNVQVGVGSFAWPDLPDVFARVTSYLPWIKSCNC